MKKQVSQARDDSARIGQLKMATEQFVASLPEWKSRIRIFSDSIFFFFDGEPSESVPKATSPEFALFFGTFISSTLWAKGHPHRGALAHGRCYLEKTGSVFLGRPIVRAHQWEQAQEFLGISLEPGSISKAVEQGFAQHMCQQSIPIKGGAVSSYYLRPYLKNEISGDGKLALPSREAVANGFASSYKSARDQMLLSVLPKYTHTARLLRMAGVDSKEFEFLWPKSKSD